MEFDSESDMFCDASDASESADPAGALMDALGVPENRRAYVRTTIHGDDWGDGWPSDDELAGTF